MAINGNKTIICKYCNSTNVVKFGTYKGNQRYWCKDCQRKFKDDDCLFQGKLPANDISIYQWVEKFTDMAVNHSKRGGLC